jgi:hypothetical protein
MKDVITIQQSYIFMNNQNAFVADRTYAIHVLDILLIELIIK